MYTVAQLLLKFETAVDGLWVDHGQYKTAHYCLFVHFHRTANAVYMLALTFPF